MSGTQPPASGEPRRVSRISPFVHGARIVPAVLIGMIAFGSQWSAGVPGLGVAVAFGTAVGAGLLVAAYRWIAWRRLTFWFDADGDLRMNSGVWFRNERRLQLSRLQSVDVTQPLIARIAGMAALHVEAAGAGDSRLTLEYLTVAQAQVLRDEIIARSAGLRHDAGAAPEQILVQVPTGDLLKSLLLRGTTVMLFLLTILVVVGALATAGTAGLLVIIGGGLPLLTVFSEFAKFFGFTVADSPDGLRLRHGLLQTSAQTVPPGRVQAVGFTEPWLWRSRGWVRVSLNVAGVGTGSQGSGNDAYTENVLLPVAPWPVALSVVARVLPGVDVTALEMHAVPSRARRRAPIQFRRLLVGHDAHVFAAARGRVVHHLALIPHARTQSVRVTQGPWERALGLASVHVDSTPGPVQISGLHRPAAEARAIAEAQLRRAAAARTAAGTQRWMASAEPGNRAAES